jgi:hypothetical protein
LKAIILSNWTSQDMRSLRGYSTSYTLRQDDQELFTIHLNRNKGFYLISEFQSPDPSQNFIIEQTNRVGTPRIAAFDKESGNMLGAFKGNTLLDSNDTPIFEIQPISKVTDIACPPVRNNAENYAAVRCGEPAIGVIISLLPQQYAAAGLLSSLRRLTRRLTSAPQDVLEVVMMDGTACDLRMLCAVAVIMHSRGGLQLK